MPQPITTTGWRSVRLIPLVVAAFCPGDSLGGAERNSWAVATTAEAEPPRSPSTEQALVAATQPESLEAVFSQAGFTYSLQAHGITLYSTSPIPPEAVSLLRTIRTRIATSPFYHNGDRFTISVCNSRRMYAALSPRSPNSFAVSRPLRGGVLMASADLEKNIARSFASEYNQRTFAGVAVHEVGHSMLRKHVGLLSTIPRWLSEGYCDYLAGDSSFPEREGDRLLASGQTHPSGAFRYLTFRRMVQYLIDQRGLSIEELVRHPPDEKQVERDMREWLKTRQDSPSATATASSPAEPPSRPAP